MFLTRVQRSRLASCALLALAAVLHTPAALAQRGPDCIDQHAEAQEFRVADKLLEARQLLATCAEQPKCPGVIRNECLQMLKEVDAAMPSLVFAARDRAGKDTVRVRVYRDGELILGELGVDGIELNPGRYRFRFIGPEGDEKEEHIVVRVGERNRLVLVDFQGSAPAPAASPPEPAAEDSGGGSTLGYALLATSVVGAGLGTYFGLRASAKNDESAEFCDGNRCSPRGIELRDEAIGSATLSTVSFATALVSGGVAAYLLLGSTSPAEKREAAAARVDVRAGSRYVGASLSGEFW